MRCHAGRMPGKHAAAKPGVSGFMGSIGSIGSTGKRRRETRPRPTEHVRRLDSPHTHPFVSSHKRRFLGVRRASTSSRFQPDKVLRGVRGRKTDADTEEIRHSKTPAGLHTLSGGGGGVAAGGVYRGIGISSSDALPYPIKRPLRRIHASMSRFWNWPRGASHAFRQSRRRCCWRGVHRGIGISSSDALPRPIKRPLHRIHESVLELAPGGFHALSGRAGGVAAGEGSIAA